MSELQSAVEWVKKQGLGFPATHEVFESDLKKAYKAGFEEGLALFNLPKGYRWVIVLDNAEAEAIEAWNRRAE